LNLTQLAVRYLITGLIVIYIRGLVTERITNIMWSRQTASA
jgi:PTS system glucitol/sorbitol-specific IIC component